MKQYAVIHIQKGAGGVALGRHIDRLVTPANADKSLSNNNYRCYVADNRLKFVRLSSLEAPLHRRVEERIKAGYTGTTAIRKDAVRQLNVILTGSHERMLAIGRDPKQWREWVADNYRFLAKQFGLANIVGFAVHMDEATPHIHATVVPLTPDGRLSAKELMGNKHQLKALQDGYGMAMKKHGLERGEVNSKAHHVNTQVYYNSINQTITAAEANITEAPAVALPPLFGRDKYQQELQQHLSDYAAQTSRILKEKEFRLLNLERENKLLKSPKKAMPSSALAAVMESQRIIKQQQQPRQSRGMGL